MVRVSLILVLHVRSGSWLPERVSGLGGGERKGVGGGESERDARHYIMHSCYMHVLKQHANMLESEKSVSANTLRQCITPSCKIDTACSIHVLPIDTMILYYVTYSTCSVVLIIIIKEA